MRYGITDMHSLSTYSTFLLSLIGGPFKLALLHWEMFGTSVIWMTSEDWLVSRTRGRKLSILSRGWHFHKLIRGLGENKCTKLGLCKTWWSSGSYRDLGVTLELVMWANHACWPTNSNSTRPQLILNHILPSPFSFRLHLPLSIWLMWSCTTSLHVLFCCCQVSIRSLVVSFC
jgi:hypothetical protein